MNFVKIYAVGVDGKMDVDVAAIGVIDMDKPTQGEAAREELRLRKIEREEERESRKRSYGILNRKHAKSEVYLKWLKDNCKCGAITDGGFHAPTCPVKKAVSP